MTTGSDGDQATPGTATGSARRLLVVAAFLTAFGVMYLIDPPAPVYRPVERAWTLADAPGTGPIMRWFGRVGAALLAATLAGAVAWIVAGQGARRPAPVAGPLPARAALAAALFLWLAALWVAVQEIVAWTK